MGRLALLNCCNGKKHKGNDIKVKSFFHPKRGKANPNKAVETDTAYDTLESSESSFTPSQPCSSKIIVCRGYLSPPFQIIPPSRVLPF